VTGCVVEQENIDTIADLAHQSGLSVHLDGARLFNSAVKQKRPASTLVAQVDSVSICLSKGLGAPAGSVLAGPAALIKIAARQRKLLGGGMRQAGMLAACGLYALDNNIDRLAIDHANAARLADALAQIDDLQVDRSPSQTNMFFIQPQQQNRQALADYLLENGVIIGSGSPVIRMVTHLDISGEDAERVLELFKNFYGKLS
jgi:threonine aldolase